MGAADGPDTCSTRGSLMLAIPGMNVPVTPVAQAPDSDTRASPTRSLQVIPAESVRSPWPGAAP